MCVRCRPFSSLESAPVLSPFHAAAAMAVFNRPLVTEVGFVLYKRFSKGRNETDILGMWQYAYQLHVWATPPLVHEQMYALHAACNEHHDGWDKRLRVLVPFEDVIQVDRNGDVECRRLMVLDDNQPCNARLLTREAVLALPMTPQPWRTMYPYSQGDGKILEGV